MSEEPVLTPLQQDTLSRKRGVVESELLNRVDVHGDPLAYDNSPPSDERRRPGSPTIKIRDELIDTLQNEHNTELREAQEKDQREKRAEEEFWSDPLGKTIKSHAGNLYETVGLIEREASGGFNSVPKEIYRFLDDNKIEINFGLLNSNENYTTKKLQEVRGYIEELEKLAKSLIIRKDLRSKSTVNVRINTEGEYSKGEIAKDWQIFSATPKGRIRVIGPHPKHGIGSRTVLIEDLLKDNPPPHRVDV